MSNKSEAIRAALAKNPKVSAHVIVETLAKDGVKVAPSLVYAVKAQKKRAKKVRKPSRRRKAKPVDAGLTMLLAAKSYVSECGGIGPARQALLTLEKLVAD